MWFPWLPYDSFVLDALAVLGGLTALLLVTYSRRKNGLAAAMGVYFLVTGFCCFIQRLFLDTDEFGSIFGLMRVLSWFLFFFGPLAFFLTAHLEERRKTKKLLLISGALLMIIGVEGFLIEPQQLKVTHYEIQHAKIKSKKRIVLLADIQTDVLNSHTRRALQTAMEQEPDAIFFAGDYLQFSFVREFPEHVQPFNNLLKEYGYDKVPLFVVEGDVESKLTNEWHNLFAGLSVTIFETSHRTVWQEIDITGLTMRDSKEGQIPAAEESERFSIILGHNPNFSLAQPNADLYLAGHTHGGQVQIPFVGPLITLSKIPNAQAHGQTKFAEGHSMIVSRGIGMERYDAPRVRFLCPPEIVVIDLLPET